MKSPLPPTTEKAFLGQVVQLLDLFGWLHYHPWLSIRSVKGFPDLTMVRNGQLLFAELKTAKGKLTPEQANWIERLTETGCRVYIWRPCDLEEIARILR